MAGNESDPQREFLLKDFEHIAESYWRNEELGESRLNVFIGVVTAVLGGVGYLACAQRPIVITGIGAS